VKILPPFWALIYLALGMTLHSLWLWGGGIRTPIPSLGILSLAAGFSIIVWAWKIFHAVGTAVHPLEETTRFVQEGPYRFTRNPMYLGITLILLGIAVFAGTPPALTAPLGFFITINLTFIPYEEKKMKAKFGEAYLAYKARVRRWI